MIVANPRFNAQTVQVATTTSQVAPTIIAALGLNPLSLDAVAEEGTQVLPEVALQLANR
jgi:hypothetical protein